MRWGLALLPPLALGLMWALSAGQRPLDVCVEELAEALVGADGPEVQALRERRDALLSECAEVGC